VAVGGRGSGKSYGVADVMVHRAIAEPNTLILCTRDTQNSLSDSALAIMKRVIDDRGLGVFFEQTRHGLKCVNGSYFIFRGLQHPDRIKSLDGIKYCWVEEAQKVSQEAWDMLTPTIREEGSEIWVTFNPDVEDDPAYRMFVTNEREDAEVVWINYHDNRFFPDVLRHEMEYDKRTDYEKYLHIWEGQCRSYSDAQVFKGKWRVAQFGAPDDAVFYFGADWGFSQDPTALVRCYISDGILWIDHEAYGVGVDIDDTPSLFDAVPGAGTWMITADSARPETISYMQKRGYRMRGAVKGKGSVEDGIAFLRSFEEIVVHERCKHVADEMKLYSYKTDKLTGDVLPVLEDKHNHCIDALRYALEQVMLRNRIPTVTVPFKR
jgi:phage terminase large subunit